MPPEDPRMKLINKLLGELGEEGDIIVYNRSFECRVFKELMRDFPEYADGIDCIIERIKDLMVPFKERQFYSPGMRGSYSIKAVLPVLVPELDYTDLAVSEGASAMYAYERLRGERDQSATNETKKNLLEYCERDTLAMVKILEALENL
jgi:hypothetical protein